MYRILTDIPNDEIPSLSIKAGTEFVVTDFELEGGYSPRVLTFMDGDSFREGVFKVNYKILSDGYIYTGVRNIEARYDNEKEVKYDDSIFFGFQVRF